MMDATDLDWAAIAAEGYRYPHGVTASHLAAELTERLTSRDPRVRDIQAYSTAAVWIREGRFDAVLEQVGDDAAARFGHPEVQARTFAPLVLDLVLTRSLQAPGLVDRRRRRALVRGLLRPGIRPSATPAGGTTRLGWLHAVAHGADVASTFAEVLPRHRGAVLELCALRMTARDTDYRYAQLEDARLARAITAVLLRADLTPDHATDWLAIVEDAFAGAGPGPVPAWASNTFATLQSLHLHLARGLADGGTPPHADAVAARVAAVLRGPYPWLA